MTDLKQTFWTRMDDVEAGLLDADGERPVPMAPRSDPDDTAIWFITSAGSAAHRASKSGGEARFTVADPGAKLYATLDGRIDEHTNPDKLDELWTASAAAWFPDGREDEAVRLVKFSPHVAEVWATEGAAATLAGMIKAATTGEVRDPGDHGRLVF